MTERLVTVATFSLAIQADLAKTKLESEGIECFLADEYTVTMNWLYSNAVGGVKLKVREADAQKAIEALEQAAPISPENQASAGDEVHCPRCNSTDVRYEKFARRLIFASWLLLSFPLPFLKEKWKCEICGHEWRD